MFCIFRSWTRRCRVVALVIFFTSFSYSHDKSKEQIVEDMLAQLTIEEKIGQLFMVATVADPDFLKASSMGIDPATYQRVNKEYIDYLINEYHIGGIIFQRLSTPAALVSAIDHYQGVNSKHHKFPLLIGQDLEWGLAMRIVDVIQFPRNMALGAIEDNKLIYAMGKEIGRQCKLLGVHINFSPVVDINTNPSNPIIGDRSFGEDKELVVQKAIAMMHGLQDAGIIAVGKHFPGHGDTSQDSHLELPVVEHDCNRIGAIELYPFRELIKHGIMGIMTAHLDVPALEPQRCASSLSRSIVTNLLRDQLKFKGLAITDGLDMKGVCKDKSVGLVELQALLAGNDILLCPKNVPEAVERIKKAIYEGALSMGELDEHVRKILHAKLYAFGSFEQNSHHLSSVALSADLHKKETYELKKSLCFRALTLAKNVTNAVPLKKGSKVIYVQVGGEKGQQFCNKLSTYFFVKNYYFPSSGSKKEAEELIKKIGTNRPIIIACMGMNRSIAQNYGITPAMRYLIDTICNDCKNVVLALFGSPYALKLLRSIPTVLVAYEDDPDAQEGAAKIIAGEYNPTGKLPVTISSSLKAGIGLSYRSKQIILAEAEVHT